MLEIGPFIRTIFSLLIDMDRSPCSNLIFTSFFTKPFLSAAIAVAQAAVPHAFVNPAPLSHTFTLIDS